MERKLYVSTLILGALSQLFCVYAVIVYESNGCSSDNGNYTQGSVYQQNLNHLFSNLSSQTRSRRFYSTTIGDFPNKVYGIYLCREDFTLEVCNECIDDATQKIIDVCPLYVEGIVWYDECMLRYANRSIFSLNETSPDDDAWYTDGVSKFEEFVPVIEKTMKGVISEAARTSARGHFASTYANYTSMNRVYNFAMCTPDIDEFGCKNCLSIALKKISTFYNKSKGVTSFYPSCQLGYDTAISQMTHVPLTPNQAQDSGQAPSPASKRQKRSSHIAVAISVPLILVALLLSSAWFCVCYHKRKNLSPDAEGIVGVDSLQFNFKAIRDATENFSENNKLGEGGFGRVYKGKLQDGQEVAVKRLSTYSGQGSIEFKTEILLAAKLQHNNLVKLLGFCLHGEEKLLVYELLPNSSLDKVLFYDQNEHPFLDWDIRFKILLGTARGLLYLHEDSRLKIIHRDLKPSNILLDEYMNAKISDFGLARLVGRDQMHADTSKVAGTYGYMAPEYALTGRFSLKSDVYSFGVIALEIVSGHMCSSTTFPYHEDSLLIRAWNLWKDNTTLYLVDPKLNANYSSDEMTRCIHLGLLCIQEDSNKRPTMAMVVSVLNGHKEALSEPEPPLVGPSRGDYRANRA